MTRRPVPASSRLRADGTTAWVCAPTERWLHGAATEAVSATTRRLVPASSRLRADRTTAWVCAPTERWLHGAAAQMARATTRRLLPASSRLRADRTTAWVCAPTERWLHGAATEAVSATTRRLLPASSRLRGVSVTASECAVMVFGARARRGDDVRGFVRRDCARLESHPRTSQRWFRGATNRRTTARTHRRLPALSRLPASDLSHSVGFITQRRNDSDSRLRMTERRS
mmetsp:Transcript_34025/g.109218  ORF Transcript_34025/g.109218 Transcript_34025/m.109218 type:complete len:229 (+) Transcript_34025:1-687(+)